MTTGYVHGYDDRERQRLRDQASTLVELLHGDTRYPAGSRVLEAGCGVGAQTVTLAANSPGAAITAIDVSATSLAAAETAVRASGATNVTFRRASLFDQPFAPGTFDHVFVCFVLEHLAAPARRPARAAGHAQARRHAHRDRRRPRFGVSTIRAATGRSVRFSASSICRPAAAATP